MNKILGLDFGEKKIGVAISDEIGMLARPLLTINAKKEALGEIKKVCEENQIKEIIIGMPKTLKGELGPQAQKVVQFKDELKEKIDIPVTFEDERLTSKMVEKMLIKEGVGREKRNKIIDQLSARAILQSYLDKNYKEGSV